MIATLWDRPDTASLRPMEDEERPVVGPRDARIRIISALMLISAAIVVTQWQVLVAFVILTSVFARATGLTFREQQHRLIHIEGFLLALLVLLPLTIPGTPLLTYGWLIASLEGAQRAVVIALKVLTSALIIFALLGSLEPVRMGRALAALNVPHRLVHLLLFAIRYIAVFRKETARLRDAMRTRAFRPGTNVHTLNTFGNLIGMMLVRSLERAERVDEAMRCRAFSGHFPLRPPKPLRTPDIVFGFALAAVAMAFVMVSRLL